jgi:hypothetical protein
MDTVQPAGHRQGAVIKHSISVPSGLEALGRVWWVLRGFFPTKREPMQKQQADSEISKPGGLVGFVGFGGFTDRRSASK